MTAARPSLLVVIVNYRTPRLVVECLRSLQTEVLALPGTTVTVVDNASGDDSLPTIGAAIRDHGWTWATLLPSPHNGGFAAGNNLAIRQALAQSTPPDVVWLLNPDTVVEPGALAALADFFAARPQVGICGGRILEADRQPWLVALRFPGILSEFERGFEFGPVSRMLRRWAVRQPIGEEPMRVDWVSGATMAIRRSTFERIGLLDERYFLYYEETDFCLRAHRAGIECWQLPQSRIVHIAGQSTQVTRKDAPPRRIPAYWFQSRRRYFAKNHGRVYAMIADLAWLLAHGLGSLRRLVQQKPAERPPKLVADFLRHSALWHAHDEAGEPGAPAAAVRETA